MAKITFIGAGSTVFARNLLGDILSYDELAGSEIALFDIDAGRRSSSRTESPTRSERRRRSWQRPTGAPRSTAPTTRST
jgi:alpha-galactosidase/6-phospho-beta-glucosidase family protein